MEAPAILLPFYIKTPVLFRRKKKQWGDQVKQPLGLWVQIHTHTLKAYRRLWPQNRGGSVRRRQWETKGWHISWARSPAARGGCKDPCGSRGAAATTGTSESDMKNTPEICSCWSDWECVVLYVVVKLALLWIKGSEHSFGSYAHCRSMTCYWDAKQKPQLLIFFYEFLIAGGHERQHQESLRKAQLFALFQCLLAATINVRHSW